MSLGRAHYWQYVLNTEGQPVSGAVIRLLTTTPAATAVLHTTEDDISGADEVYSVITDNNGFFEFWVANASDKSGYSTNTSFSLQISRGTGETQTIEDIHLHFIPPRVFYQETLDSTWLSSGKYMYNITHNLNTLYPLVQVWNGSKAVNNMDIYSVGVNTICLSSATDPGVNIHVIVVGNDT